MSSRIIAAALSWTLVGCAPAVMAPVGKPVAKAPGVRQIELDGGDIFFTRGGKVGAASVHAVSKKGGAARDLYKAPQGGVIDAMAVGPGADVTILARLPTETQGRSAPVILAIPKKGGAPREVARFGETEGTRIDGLAVDATHAYVILDFQVRRVPLAGGDAEVVLQTEKKPEEAPWAIHVDDDTLYVSSERSVIWRAPKAGGDAEKLIVHNGRCLVAQGGRLYWGVVGPGQKAFAVHSIPLDGAVARATADTLEHPYASCPLSGHRGFVFAADRGNVLGFADATSKGVKSLEPVIMTSTSPIVWLDVDDSGLYGATQAGTIVHTPIKFK